MLGFALETGPVLSVAGLNDVILGAGLGGGELVLTVLRVAEEPRAGEEEAKVGHNGQLFAQDEVPHSITLGTNTSALLLSRSEDRHEPAVVSEKVAITLENLSNAVAKVMD